jgi:hypothetical protein
LENKENNGLLSKLKGFRDSTAESVEKIGNSKAVKTVKGTKNVLSYLFTDKGYEKHSKDIHKTLKDTVKNIVLSEYQKEKKDFEENLKQTIDILLKDLKGDEADEIKDKIMKETVSKIMKRDKDELSKIMKDSKLMTEEFTASLDGAMKPFEKVLSPDHFSDTIDNAIKRAFFGDIEQKNQKENKKVFDEISNKVDNLPDSDEINLSIKSIVKEAEGKLSKRVNKLDTKLTKLLLKSHRPDLDFDNAMAGKNLGENKPGLFKKLDTNLKTDQSVNKDSSGGGLLDMFLGGASAVGAWAAMKKMLGIGKTPVNESVNPKVKPNSWSTKLGDVEAGSDIKPVNKLAPVKPLAQSAPVSDVSRLSKLTSKIPTGVSKGLKVAGNVASKVAVPLTGAIAGYDRYNQVKNDETLSTGQKTTKVAATAGGAMAGAATGAMTGAAIGSVVPVFGTAIGGIVGGIAGAYLGQKGGDALGDYASSKMQSPKAPAGYIPQKTVPGIKQGPVPDGMLPPPPLLVKQIDRVENAADKLEGLSGTSKVSKNNKTVIKKPVTIDQKVAKIEQNTKDISKNVSILTRNLIKEKQKESLGFDTTTANKPDKSVKIEATNVADEGDDDDNKGFLGSITSGYQNNGLSGSIKAGAQYISNKVSSGGGLFGGSNNGGGSASPGSFFSKAWQNASNAVTNIGNSIKGKGFKLSGGVNYQGVNSGVKKNFEEMAAEYKQKTGKDILITSGYRSSEEQARLYASKPKGMAAKPGRSMHEYGMAIDIDPSNANDLANMGLLSKYGFDRPYLYNRGETWHIEPVGLNKDAIMKAGYQNTQAATAKTSTPSTQSSGVSKKPTATDMATDGVDTQTLEADKEEDSVAAALDKKTYSSPTVSNPKAVSVDIKPSDSPVTVAHQNDKLDTTKTKKAAPIVINNQNNNSKSEKARDKSEFGMKHLESVNPYITALMTL